MVDFRRIIDIFPDIFPRDPESTLFQYLGAHEDRADELADDLEDIRESHFVDTATGDDLDRVGAMFGPLGRRAGRDDQEYRVYLRSIVQAYKGAGTVPGIKSAVSAGLDNNEDDIEIFEYFEDLEYEISITDWDAHRGSTVEELAELAGPSVAELNAIRYNVGSETAALGEEINITEGYKIEDILGADDIVEIDTINPTIIDTSTSSIIIGVDPDKTSIEETNLSDDDIGVDADKTSIDETNVADDDIGVDDSKQYVEESTIASDTVETDVTRVGWNTAGWGEMNWS